MSDEHCGRGPVTQLGLISQETPVQICASASKFCASCGTYKSLGDFHKNKAKPDGLSWICKSCRVAKSKEYYQKDKAAYVARATQWNKKSYIKIRQLIAALKDVPCADCGQRFPSECMDFDHVRGKKLFDVASAPSRQLSEKRLLAEVQKCEIVCANCHRIRTAKRRVEDNLHTPNGSAVLS